MEADGSRCDCRFIVAFSRSTSREHAAISAGRESTKCIGHGYVTQWLASRWDSGRRMRLTFTCDRVQHSQRKACVTIGGACHVDAIRLPAGAIHKHLAETCRPWLRNG